MPDIVLTTINARYQHSALGLRYLWASLGDLQPRATLCEFTLSDRPIDIVQKIIAVSPRIVGFGVYIWNVEPVTHVVRLLKALRPDIIIIVGGPEVSFELDDPSQIVVQAADYVITGEGERSFFQLCNKLLSAARPLQKVIVGELADLKTLVLPYDFYNEEDIERRTIYVEASRGCPYECEFCLSSLDQKVRTFSEEHLFGALEKLLKRGVREFKFVDRTFNLGARSRRILEFFLSFWRDNLFLHFEMIPDLLPSELKELIARFPPGTLQLEVGIQTLNSEIAARISRQLNVQAIAENLTYLRQHTHAHIHADLIVGLPGEDVESFAQGFDTLLNLRPHEIQVGILKRLRGTPIARHTNAWGMIYNPLPPYDVLQTSTIDFVQMQRLKRFAHLWDVVVNSGNFVQTAPLLWEQRSPFAGFLEFTEAVFARFGRVHAINLESLASFLLETAGDRRSTMGATLWEDFVRLERRVPGFLIPYAPRETPAWKPQPARGLRERQRRHHLS